jgi:hypothetical protein
LEDRARKALEEAEERLKLREREWASEREQAKERQRAANKTREERARAEARNMVDGVKNEMARARVEWERDRKKML